MLTRIILCLTGLMPLLAVLAQPAQEMSKLLHAYEAYGRLSGTVWVQEGDSVLFAEAYGCADFGTQAPNQLSSVFSIGSLSKQFTAAAILHLVHQGKIDLQSPINAYLGPYASERWRKVTVHHLLSHTSGIPSLLQSGQGLDDVFPEEEAIERSALIGYFQDLKLMSKPGKRYRYNNSGYVLLAAIVEQVSGQPYGQFMQEQLFRPYGLNNTSHGAPDDQLARPHYGYAHKQGRPVPIYHESWLIGAGSIYSTVQDLARWNKMIHSEAFLTPELRHAYFSPHEATAGRNAYAYGWEVLQIDGHSYLHHDGTIMGYTCDLLYEPQTELLSIMLTNQTFEDLSLIGKSEQFVRVTNLSLLEVARGASNPGLPLPQTETKALEEGTYHFANGYPLQLAQQAGEWHIQSDSISPLTFAYEVPIALNTELRQRADRAIQSLTQKRFRKFARECDGTMKTLTYLGVIRLGMKSIMKGMGEWQRSVFYEENDRVAYFRMFCKNGTVDFSIHFNEEDKIQGIFDIDRASNSASSLPLQLKAWPVKGGLFVDGFAFGQQDLFIAVKGEGQLTLRQGSRLFESE